MVPYAVRRSTSQAASACGSCAPYRDRAQRANHALRSSSPSRQGSSENRANAAGLLSAASGSSAMPRRALPSLVRQAS